MTGRERPPPRQGNNKNRKPGRTKKQNNQTELTELIKQLNAVQDILPPQFKAELFNAMQTGNTARLELMAISNREMIQRAMAWLQHQTMMAQQDPWYPGPAAENFQGNILIGAVGNESTTGDHALFHATLESFKDRWFICGSAGKGKTRAEIAIIENILEEYGDAVKVWIFDRKKSFRNFFHPDFLTLNFSDFRDPGLRPPIKGMPDHKWRNRYIDLTAKEQYVKTASKYTLLKFITQTITRTKTPYPSNQDILQTLNMALPKAKSFRESGPIESLINRYEALVDTDIHTRNIHFPDMDLMNTNILVECDEDMTQIETYRTALMLDRLYTYKKHKRLSGDQMPFNLIVIDEGRDMFAKRGSDFSESVLETMFAVSREMDIGFIICTQEPKSVSQVLKANVSTVLAFPLSDGKERRDISSSLNLNKKQYDFYSMLASYGKGFAITRSDDFERPFIVQIPDVPDPTTYVTDQDLDQHKQPILDKFKTSKPDTLSDTKPTDTPKPRIIPDDSVTILETLKLEPFLNVTQLIEACNFSIEQYSAACDWLVRNDYLMPHKIRAGRKGPLSKFHGFKDSAYSFLEIPKPSWGKEGFRHRYYKHIMGRHFDALGWTIEPEAKSQVSDHKFDLLATLNDEVIDIEITLNSKNLHDNIVNGFDDKRITQILVVCEKDDLIRFKSKVVQDVLDNGYRLEFRPITTFFPN